LKPGSSLFCPEQTLAMRFFIPVVLVLVALIHALPIVGVLGADPVARLYGVSALDTNVELLLRHRAVLFGLLATFLAYAAFRPELHRAALAAGFVSAVSFLVLSHLVGAYNSELATVVRVDWAALALLVAGAVAHALRRGE
jgi:uncharacterized BrkB/YihY/UPF0761 family membrane protein